MQIAEDRLDPPVVTVLGPSLALDLSWAAHSMWSPRLRVKHRVLAALSEEHPELRVACRDFWDDGVDCFPELQVLAYNAGALEHARFDPLFEALGTARAVVPEHMTLRSETDEVRRAVFARLAALRGDRRWAGYVELWRGLYLPLATWWLDQGIPAVEQAAAAARRELERGTPWIRMIPTGCHFTQDRLPEIVDSGDPLILAPCALFGEGLYLDLPGSQLVGLDGGTGDSDARARTAELARRIRVLADPTRLAILDHLRAGPRSVGDLAVDFGLTQPTVSVHVKQLRQAGLVTATRRGPRLELTVNAEALQALAGELATLVSA